MTPSPPFPCHSSLIFFKGQLIRALLLVFSVFAASHAQLAAQNQAKNSAAFSRGKILPLVAKPGKSRRIFSSFKKGQSVTWNEDFWGASLGFKAFTGMGWHQPQAGVLITPEHVVGAAHYGLNHRGVDFYGLDGKYLGNRKPAKNAEGKALHLRLKPDVMLIRLDSAAPDGAAVIALPAPEGFSLRRALTELPPSERPLMLATDWRNPRATPPAGKDGKPKRQRWISTRTAHPVLFRSLNPNGMTMHWTYGKAGDAGVDPSYHETVNKGDSSNPIFWLTKSGWVLASHFSGVNGGPDYGNPELQKAIQEGINQLGGSKPYQLKFAPVP